MGNRKCCKCFRHEKKTVPYQGHICPYRDCNCEGCQPKRKGDISNVKRGRPRLASASYQLSMMSGMQLSEQTRYCSAGGIPHLTMSSRAAICNSSIDCNSVSARQAPPVIQNQPATSQAFILINNTKNVSELHTYVKKEGIRNMPPNMINVLYQKGMPSSTSRSSSASYLPANNSETYSRPQIPIRRMINISMESKGSRQAIQIPFTAPKLLNSNGFTHMSSSAGSVPQSNAVPTGYYPMFSSFESANSSKSEINPATLSSTTKSITINTSQIPSPRTQDRFSCNVNYNHPILKNANQRGTFKHSVPIHQPTSNVVHFSQQSNRKIDKMKLSSLPFQSVPSTFSRDSSLSECSRNWSQSPLASTSEVPGNSFVNETRIIQPNSALKSDDGSEHAPMNQANMPSRLLSSIICSHSMNPASPIFNKPDSLPYNIAHISFKRKKAVIDQLKCNSKFSLQVQQANAAIKAANYENNCEHETNSIVPLSMPQPSLSSMTSSAFKIAENVSSSFKDGSLQGNIETLFHSNSNLKTDQSEIIDKKDGLGIEKCIKDTCAIIPPPTEYFMLVPTEATLNGTSEQKKPFIGLEFDVGIEQPIDDWSMKSKEDMNAGNCQEPNEPCEGTDELIGEISSLNIKIHGEENYKFSVLKDEIYSLKLMFPELPIQFLLPIYSACDCKFFLAIQELSIILKKKRISPELMARCQHYSERFVAQQSAQKL